MIHDMAVLKLSSHEIPVLVSTATAFKTPLIINYSDFYFTTLPRTLNLNTQESKHCYTPWIHSRHIIMLETRYYIFKTPKKLTSVYIYRIQTLPLTLNIQQTQHYYSEGNGTVRSRVEGDKEKAESPWICWDLWIDYSLLAYHETKRTHDCTEESWSI